MSFSSTLSKLVLLPLAALLFWGCRSKIEVKVDGRAPAGLTEGAATVPMKILSRMPVIASPGERVTIDGQGFRSVMTLALADGRAVDLKVESDSKASFVMPSELSFGEMALTARQEGQTQALTLVFDAGRIDYPLFSGPADKVCEGEQFYNRQGVLVSGTKNCAAAANASKCQKDGELDCVTHVAFPSADKAKLIADNIKQGVTIAGVTGSLAATSAAVCAVDGATGCLASASYPAAAAAGLAAKVLQGQTVAGMAGTVTLPAVGKVLSGVSYGVGGSSLSGMLTLPSASNVRSGSGSYGDPAGAMTPSYSPDFPDVANVLSSDTVNGAAGSLTLPLAANVRVSNGAFGVGGNSVTPALANCAADGGEGCVTTAAYKAVNMYNFTDADVRIGVTIAGVAGSLTGAPSACGADGDTGCIANASYRAAATSGLADKVLSGQTVAATAGNVTLPAVGKVLASTSYGVGGTGSTGTLTLPSASNVLTGSGAYGDPGSAVTPSYSPDFPAVANVLSSATVNGAAGTLTLPSAANVRASNGVFGAGGSSVTPTLADCSSDGASGCVAVGPSYVAMVVAGAQDKILSGSSVGAISGNVTLPAVGKVLSGIQYGAAGTGLTGTLSLPAAGSVLSGSGTYGDPGSAVTPSYSPDFPDVGSVLSSDTVNSVAGTLTLPAVGQVLASTQYGVGGNGSTGTLTLPSASNVLTGSGAYGDPGSVVTPSYNPDFPDVANVLSSDTVNGASGALTLPAAGKVLASTQYGVGGTGSTGTLTLPSAGNVLTGSGTYGDPGATVTPSYSPDFPDAENVLSTDTVNGASGTLTLPLAANVRVSNGAFGASGNSVTPTLADCSDGNSGCVAVGPTYVAMVAGGAQNKILSGETLGGISGNVTLPAVGKVLASVQYGVSGTSLAGTLTLPAAGDVLVGSGSYGDPGAPVTPSYNPDFPDVANVLSSDTVNSVAGTLTLPNTGDVYTGIQYGSGGTSLTGALTLASAGNVRTAQGAFGRSGNSVTPTLADCSSDGGVSCVVDNGTNYKAASSSVLLAGNIKRGVQIGGVTGNFPSSTSPLPRYSDSGGTTNTTGSDETDLTNFVTQLTSAGTFEFWDSTGIRRTGSGDADIVASNVKAGVAFENLSLTGTLPSGPSCSSDGETGCVTTSRYKSMDTDSSVISAWDIRKGKTAGGLSGEIVFYKNMANLTRFDRTTGAGGVAGLDIYDTIDDFNNNGAFTTQNPGGWDQATGANWLRDSTSDSNSNGICDGSEKCVYIDRITGLYWAQADLTVRTWENAITYCNGLNGSSFGGYASGWRLPTQKELQQAYINGVWSQKDAAKLNLIDTVYYWSSSTYSSNTSASWGVYLNMGYTNGSTAPTTKTQTQYVLCVR